MMQKPDESHFKAHHIRRRKSRLFRRGKPINKGVAVHSAGKNLLDIKIGRFEFLVRLI